MIIDVHCHVGFSRRPIDLGLERFSFESSELVGAAGCDSYFSERMLKRPGWFFIKRMLGIDPSLPAGEAMDAQIEQTYERHFDAATSADRLVLLAFDAYHTNDGTAIGSSRWRRDLGTDLYVSNSLVRAMCHSKPHRYLFGASIHPYRRDGDRDACALLDEVVEGGAALVKWLPVHQNIAAEDERTVAFLRRAAELRIPMLIHYGGEMSLTRQHADQEHPGKLIESLRRLRTEGAMPTVIVAHAATPSFPWQDESGYRCFIEALLGEFCEAPLYADNSALAALGRTSRLRELADRPELHSKLVWGSDFPIPVLLPPFWFRLDRSSRRIIRRQVSWIERDYKLKRALGFGDEVFHRATDLLRYSTA